MRWRRIALPVTFLVLALAGLAVGWLWTADLGVFKPQLERFVTQKTGRDFVIDGKFSVDLAGRTTLIAEDVRLANPAWAEARDMLKIGRAEVHIDLWSLFRGPAVVELIELRDTSIQLLDPGDTPPNWELPVGPAPESEANVESGLGVLVKQIEVDRLELQLESVQRDRPLHLVIERLEQAHRDDDYLDLSARGALDGRQIEIAGELGTWSALLAGKDFAGEVDATLDTLTFSARGRVDDIAELRRPALEIAASGPDIDDLTRMLGLGENDDGDIRLSASLAPIEDGPLVLQLEGNLGRTEVDVRGEIADLHSFRDMKLRATASGPDLAQVLHLVDGATIGHSRFISAMRDAGGGPFSLDFSVAPREDGTEAIELHASTSIGELRGSGSIGDPDTLLGTTFSVQARIDRLGKLAAAYGLDKIADTRAEISGAAEYTTGGIRSDGPIILVVDGNTAEAEGVIGVQPGARGTELAVTAGGADLSDLVALFVRPVGVPALPFGATTRLRVGQDGLRLTDIEGSVGTTRVSGDGLVVPGRRIGGSWFNIAASGTEFEQLLAAFPDLRVRPGSFDLDGRIEIQEDSIAFSRVRLQREAGTARADLVVGIGGPQSRLEWDVAAEGADVRAVLGGIGKFAVSEQPFSIATRGTWRGTTSAVGKLDIAIGAATLRAAGDLEFVDGATDTEAEIALVVPSLAAIGTINDRRFRDQAVSARAVVERNNSAWSLRDLDVRFGASQIHGVVNVRPGEVPDIEIEVHSDRLAYQALLEDVEEDADSQPKFEDGRLIPDTEIPFDALRKANVSLAATVAEFQRDNLFLSDATISATLRDGVLAINDLRFKGPSGALAARATLVPGDQPGETTLQLVGRDLAFGLTEANRDLATTTDLDVNLRSSGSTLRDLAGRSNGIVHVDIRGGRVTHGRIIQAIYGGMLEEILNTINPFRKTHPDTELECLIVPLRVTDGKVKGAPSLFMSTSKIRLAAQVGVNLQSEQLEATVRTTPRRLLSVSAAELVNPYVKIEGTLAEPRLAVDEAGVLVSGGAAVATGGLTVLARGLWDRLSRAGDACGQASKQALEELAGRMPEIELERSPQSD